MALAGAWSGCPRAEQVKALFLILLILGAEAQQTLANFNNSPPGAGVGSSERPQQRTAAEPNRIASSGGGRRNDSDLETSRLFAEPEPAVIHLATERGASPRQLNVNLGADWQWPSATRLKFVSPKELREHEGWGTVEVSAALKYKSLTITANQIAGDNSVQEVMLGTSHVSPVVRLVKGDTDRYKCQDDAFPPRVVVGMTQSGMAGSQSDVSAYMGKTNSPLALIRVGAKLSTDASLGGTEFAIVFMHGGQYRLCYSPHGAFGGVPGTEIDENIVPTMIKVYGVSSGCTSADGCLQDERWECSFGYKGESVLNCEFNFKNDGKRAGWAVETGRMSKMTWSAKFGADTMNNNHQTSSMNRKTCAVDNEPPDTSVFVDNLLTPQKFMHIDRETAALMPAVKSSHSEAFGLAACYCPNFNVETGSHCDADSSAWNCCDVHQEYIQKIGRIYYWTVRLCDYQHYETCTANAPTSYRYMRVIPQQKFVVRVDCPPGGGCLPDNDNRVKLIGYNAANDLPSWDRNAGCRTSFTSRAESEVWPSSGDPGSGSGGNRQDFKAWRNRQVKMRLSVNGRMDICFANSASDSADSWFKVGEARTTRAFALAFKTGESSAIESIKFVGHPGSVTLLGGIMGLGLKPSPFEANMYSGKALINVISYDREKQYGIGAAQKSLESHYGFDRFLPDDFQQRMDERCQKEAYSPTLVDGPSSKQAAKEYVANVDKDNENTVSRYQSFSGDDKNRQMTIKKAGVVAICYCGMVSSGTADCSSSSFWVFAGRITIQGPAGGVTFTLPTQVVIKFDLEGWGFSNNDRLRIIPAASVCNGNGNDPTGSTSYKVQCPSTTSSGCRVASANEEISASVVTAKSAGINIQAVEVGTTNSQLKFDGDITPYLKDSDVITIDFDRVKVNSKDMTDGTLTATERYEAYRLSGEWEFQDIPTEKYQLGHRVKTYTVGTAVDKNRMSIPVGWVSSSSSFEFGAQGPFSFTNNQGYWTRRNKLSTAEEIKGTRAATNLKLCWGLYSNANTKFYHEAGVVNFVDPDPMASATVSLTTRQSEAVAPMVISFKTVATRSEYNSATGQTMLMLRFLDVSNKLEPYKNDRRSGVNGVYKIDSGNENAEITAANKKQQVCGEFFTEFWSSHSEGFPMPVGCHYSKKLVDAPTGQGLVFFRELFITFGELNGIRQNEEYQIVLNAQIKDIVVQDVLVDIYAMCASFEGCSRTYQVFEKGSAKASMTAEPMASSSDPRFAQDDGFTIQRGDELTQVLDLSALNILQVQLRGADRTQQIIVRQSIVRIYMWPITSWNVGSGTCSALCIPYWQTQKRCSGEVGCSSEEVVHGSGKRNIVKIKLPTEMDSIDLDTTHTIKITGLTLPLDGFFPTRVGVQLTRPEDTKPHYITSLGFIMKYPEKGQTTGRLVINGRSGYGPKPFKAEFGNALYVRLRLGATLWNVGLANAASLTINLPSEYGACSVVGAGAPPRDLKVFLRKTGGYVDNNRGELGVSTEDGDWSASSRRQCVYTLGLKYQAIYAGMVFYVALNVDNPSQPMPKTDPKNVWSIKLTSYGRFEPTITVPTYEMPLDNFISLQEEVTLGQDYWGGNTAVIDGLQQELCQPASFVRSCCGPNMDTRRSEDFVRLFFQTTTYIGQFGSVIFDAPESFEFGQECVARDLPDRHYVYVNAETLYQLKNMGSCTGQRYPTTAPTYNRAKLKVNGIMEAARYYGFQLRVLHPTTYAESQHKNWYLWVQDSNNYGLQGSMATIAFQRFGSSESEFYHQSWGMYDQPGTPLPVLIANTRPRTLTNADTKVTFYPISFPIETTTSLRISAPSGFAWDVNMNTFFRRTNGTLDDFPLPRILNTNQMVWDSITLRANTNYGFQASVAMPNFNPVVSSNDFFIEWGFRETDIFKRLSAIVVPSATINALTNTSVTYSTNLVGYQDNRMEFAVRTVTPLTEGSGVVIMGSDKTAGFAFACPFKVLPESDPVPSDARCDYKTAADNAPQISLLVGKTVLAPGYYKFEMNAINPPTLKLEPGSWRFGSYASAAAYPDGSKLLDMELDARGFRIVERMLDGALVNQITTETRQRTNRNDRPGKSNNLIFYFSLQKRPQSPRVMSLKAPRGFLFDDNCMNDLHTDWNTVFGPNTAETWPRDYEPWPQQYKPTKCVGEGREALLSIPTGLAKFNKYVFRIAIRRNPDTTPAWNRWSIAYNDETTDPFTGFTVWTNTAMSVTPVGTQKSQTGAGITRTSVPVKFGFTPFNTIPKKPPGDPRGGLLMLTAPVGFEFVQTNAECEVVLYLSDGSLTFTRDEYICQVENKVRLLLYMAAETREILGLYSYSLIVYLFHPPSSSVAAEWRMDSFSKWTAQTDSALDESRVLGYNINNVLNIFRVLNTFNILNGNTDVSDVDILLNFPDPLKDGDEVRVFGPKGFNLIGNPQLADCNGFKWADGGEGPLPSTGDPFCRCDGNMFCNIYFLIDESQDPALQQGIDIHFKIKTKNPSKTPFLMDNFWKVQHTKGTIIKSSHMVKSWSINPQLEQVDVRLVGAQQAAGKTSDILVKFMPVTDADTLVLEAVFPTQFSFDQSTVALPYDISKASEGARLIINRGGFRAGRNASIRINTVRLGRAGGQTEFNLVTYGDENMVFKKDEKLQFKRGFRLPGLITSLGAPRLRSQYAGDNAAMFPVKSLFQPRYLEDANAEFELSFSRQVQAGERLVISCHGEGSYRLKSGPFLIIGAQLGMIETSVELDKTGAIKATLKPGRPASETAIQGDTRYTIIIAVVPARGINTWRFETSDGGQLPSNTNDGTQQGFSPVEQMTLGISAVRTPPKAIVDVLLNIDAGSAIVRELIIIAPPSFLFDTSAGGCGDMCLPGEALSNTNRKTATIASPTGEPLTVLKGLRIRVLTPEQTPSSVTWFVEGRGQGAGSTTGWGEGQGFFVTQMGGTSVMYPAVSSVKGAQIAFTFALDVDAGNQISIVSPPGFLLTCSAEGSLKQISLPGSKPDCIDDPLQIRLATSLTIGRYAFALAVDLPPETPSVNTFDLIIRDQDNVVIDAAYSLPGLEIVNIGVSNPFLSWSKSDPGQRTSIEIGLTFTRDTPNVKGILIMLPDQFMHDVQNPTDVQNLNKRFPVAAGATWAETKQYPDRIRIWLDDTSGGAVIKADTYRFVFPALVPPKMSQNNIWSISMCNDK
eukprot:TRINITY_DN8222_c0_g5_i2.p1 TRINITY_DN8222_c0_g5~~TRINITY_DN8222_c0_g5_i2.p1  ORF type:complete len:3174 (-),score=522.91 TRINITY_DN8222_c0_g5_i2:21-9542(-)